MLVYFLILFCVSCGITSETTVTASGTELEGKFTSKKGVMSPISCHGFNIGYLQTGSGERIVVCFDRLPNSSDLEVPESETIHVTGQYEEHTTVANDASPCPAETITVFYADGWHGSH